MVTKRTPELELAAMMRDALMAEDYETATEIRNEVERRVCAGTIDGGMTEWVLGSKAPEADTMKLAFVRG